MSKQTYRVCFCFRRRFRLAAAEAPADVKEIFEQYSQNGVMSVDELRRFMVEVQGEQNATAEEAHGIMDGLKHLHIFQRRGLNLEGFFKYLFGDVNQPLDPKFGIHQDMTAPLSHYFIYTSHNTYLTGNQISSDSSDFPIIRALQGGVRGIELDLWPNSTKDNVVVLHGWTLTTPVTLIKCLRSIKNHAFSASEYPVIVTLEDHLTADLQALVAEMIVQTFGEMLFTPGSSLLREFPSPESLERRIIISTKPPKEYLEEKQAKPKSSNSEKGHSSPEDEAHTRKVPILEPENYHNKDDDSDGDGILLKEYLEEKKAKPRSSNTEKGHSSPEDEAHTREFPILEPENDHNKDDDTDGMDMDEDDEKDPKIQKQATPKYRNLIAIPAGKGKGGMQAWLQVDPTKVRRLSLSEQELEDAISEYGNDIIRFTQQNLLRVYPKGIRLDSSNYNPLTAWMHGAQMVALNMQGYGKSLWLMHGMFRANGSCGYVKKPDFLLKAGSNFDPKADLPVKTTLKVTVYMGEGWYYDFSHTHFDTYSPPDFYAKIGIVGVAADTMMKKTKTIDDNWIPTWDEVVEFPLRVPELALLRLEVRDDDASGKTQFAGQTCLPVWELRTGIRAVPLYSRRGAKYKCVKLLMRFEFL